MPAPGVADRANSEHRRLLAAALERIPELEPLSEEREAPEDSGNGDGREDTQEPLERRSWWRRFFGF